MSLHGFPVARELLSSQATTVNVFQSQSQSQSQTYTDPALTSTFSDLVLHWYRWRNWELLCLNVCRQRFFFFFFFISCIFFGWASYISGMLSRHVSDICQLNSNNYNNYNKYKNNCYCKQFSQRIVLHDAWFLMPDAWCLMSAICSCNQQLQTLVALKLDCLLPAAWCLLLWLWL